MTEALERELVAATGRLREELEQQLSRAVVLMREAQQVAAAVRAAATTDAQLEAAVSAERHAINCENAWRACRDAYRLAHEELRSLAGLPPSVLGDFLNTVGATAPGGTAP